MVRYSRTPAQKAAREWQVKVDMVRAAIEDYTQRATWRDLSKFELTDLRRFEKRLARLMDENPNEPV